MTMYAFTFVKPWKNHAVGESIQPNQHLSQSETNALIRGGYMVRSDQYTPPVAGVVESPTVVVDAAVQPEPEPVAKDPEPEKRGPSRPKIRRGGLDAPESKE